MLKKLIATVVIVCSFTLFGNGNNVVVSDNLINALVQVESGGNRHKVGKLGELGILQIRQCVIDDVNRVYGKKYKLSDAKDNTKAKEICRLYLKHWGSHYQRKTGKVATNQVLSKIWNGGPTGYKKRTTYAITSLDRYWQKVKRQLSA